MRSVESFATLGLRPHTYWTAAVALAGGPRGPRVIERRRIEFAVGAERFAYHRAAEAAAAKAASVIDKARALAQAKAAHAIGNLLAALQGAGVLVRIAVVPLGSAKLPEKLEDILGAHSRIHAAEGAFYRDVVAAACEVRGLEVRRAVERDLPALVGKLLRIDEPSLAARLKQMGAVLGPPWSEDQKLAALAAWLHLDEAGTGPRGGRSQALARRPRAP